MVGGKLTGEPLLARRSEDREPQLPEREREQLPGERSKSRGPQLLVGEGAYRAPPGLRHFSAALGARRPPVKQEQEWSWQVNVGKRTRPSIEKRRLFLKVLSRVQCSAVFSVPKCKLS